VAVKKKKKRFKHERDACRGEEEEQLKMNGECWLEENEARKVRRGTFTKSSIG
jgi:hypothetical protein